MKQKLDKCPNRKITLWRDNCGRWRIFIYMNLTDISTLPLDLIKREKKDFKSKINLLRYIKWRGYKIAINNGWNTQIFQRLQKEHDGKFHFKSNILSRLPNTVEISHKWIFKFSSIRSQHFILGFLMSLRRVLLEFLHVVQRLVY